ncbi:hypothetical protein [Thalassococcus lentus]|uniref:Uncharacterized protein n=1 Tax=Thalassococcus lentus TaxID=1210524 RepID=A0ABT4XMC2_9RHOB|nr:hypothetical protein [Thalassococcus lentus]MDA7423093.1 hypothetical protein [Thalassococcus lentus]
MGKATVGRAFSELVEKGFLALEREGNWYSRRAHEWRLTTKPMQRAKGKELPSHDWREYSGQEKTKLGSLAEPSQTSVVPFENPPGTSGSKREPVRRKKGRRFGSGSAH